MTAGRDSTHQQGRGQLSQPPTSELGREGAAGKVQGSKVKGEGRSRSEEAERRKSNYLRRPQPSRQGLWEVSNHATQVPQTVLRFMNTTYKKMAVTPEQRGEGGGQHTG